MGLRTLIGGFLRAVARKLLRVVETLLAVATVVLIVLLVLTLDEPDVHITDEVMQVLFLATTAVGGALALVVLLQSYLDLRAMLGGSLLPSLPSRSRKQSDGGSSLAAPSTEFERAGDGGGDDGGGGVDRIDSGDDDSGSGDGSVLGPPR